MSQKETEPVPIPGASSVDRQTGEGDDGDFDKPPDSPWISPTRPGYSRSSSFGSLMGKSFDRYGEDFGEGAATLLDVVETFFDSRLDLVGRRLKAQSARIRSRTLELIPKGLRTPGGGGFVILDEQGQEGDDGLRQRSNRGDKYKREVEREVERIKVKLASKVTDLSIKWRSAQIVRTREKVSFLFGVLSLAFTCVLYGAAPEWLPFAYTVQSAVYLPVRWYTYKRKAFHYFLFDLCYFVNILDLVWLWVFPQSTSLFIASYLLTMGPIASAIITWRNSLVFHSMDKVISLFIHMYPPIVLSVIKHSYKDAETRYPGLKGVDDYAWWKMILLSGIPYILWQAAYYKFISIDRKSKVESGERQNSFHFLVNDRRRPIGKALQGIKPEHRELWFIFWQLIYSIVFMVPPAALYIHSPRATAAFLILIFSVSAWNGASFYVEVFGRKFERELEKLRKEMELASATGAPSSSSQSQHTTSAPGTPYVDGASPTGRSEVYTDAEGDDLANSPLLLAGGGSQEQRRAARLEVPEMMLDRAAQEVDDEGKKEK